MQHEPAVKFLPKDQLWLEEMCDLVKNKMPENYRFVVFGFPTSGTDRCYYASNATRESAVAALTEWIEHTKKSWMKHE